MSTGGMSTPSKNMSTPSKKWIGGFAKHAVPGVVILVAAVVGGGCAAWHPSRPFPPSAPASSVDAEREIPSDVLWHYLRGLAYQEQDRPGEAVEEFQRAKALGGKGASLEAALGESYLAIGELDSAAVALQRALASGGRKRDVHRMLAGLSMTRGDAIGAARELEAARDLDPQHFATRMDLGGVYLQMGRDSLAARELREAARLAPGDARFSLRIAQQLMQAGDLEGARAEYQSILEEDPAQLQALVELAQLELAQGDSAGALAHLESALARRPGNLPLSRQVWRLKLRAGDREGAISLGREILKADPLDSGTAVGVASVLAEKGELREAGEILRDLGETGVKSPEVRVMQGRLAWMGGNVQAATDELEAALQLDPGHLEAMSLLGFLLIGKDELARADSLLQAVTLRDSRNPEIFFLLGIIRVRSGRLSEAVEQFRRSLELREGDVRVLFELGAAEERRGNIEEAAAAFNELLKVEPDNALTHNYLGYMFADRGIRLEESLDHIRRAVDKEPDNGYFVDSLGWVYFRMGDLVKATESLERAARLVNDAEVLAHLAEVYEARGMNDAARDCWRRALALDPGHEEWRSRLKALGGE